MENKCEGGYGNCLGQGTEQPHTCPFKEEIHDDYETLCNCCDSCRLECRYDI